MISVNDYLKDMLRCIDAIIANADAYYEEFQTVYRISSSGRIVPIHYDIEGIQKAAIKCIDMIDEQNELK